MGDHTSFYDCDDKFNYPDFRVGLRALHGTDAKTVREPWEWNVYAGAGLFGGGEHLASGTAKKAAFAYQAAMNWARLNPSKLKRG